MSKGLDQTEQKLEKEYVARRDKFFGLLSNIFEKPDALEGILRPLGQDKALSTMDMVKIAGNLLINYSGVALSTLSSIPFYRDEINKLADVIAGVKSADDENSFFLKVMNDQKTVDFIGKNNLSKFIKLIAPTVNQILIKSFSDITSAEKLYTQKKAEIENRKAEIENLSLSIDEFKRLNKLNQGRQNENKDEINKLAKKNAELANLASVQNNYFISSFLETINKFGFDKKYINEKLSPIVTELICNMIDNPAKLMTTIQSALKIVISSDQNEKSQLIKEVITELDVESLLKKNILGKTILDESANLAKKLLKPIISSRQLENLPISAESTKFIEEFTKLSLELVGNTINNGQAISDLYQDFKEIWLIKDEDTNSKNLKLLKTLAGLLTDEQNQPVRNQLIKLIKTHNNEASKILTELVSNFVASSNNPNLQILKSLNAGLLTDIIPVLSNILGNSLSDEQNVTSIYNVIKTFLLSPKQMENEEKIMQGRTASDQENGLFELLTNSKNLSSIKNDFLPILSNYSENIATVAYGFLSNDQQVPILNNIPKEVFSEIIPIALNLLSKSASILSVEEIHEIYKNIVLIQKNPDDITIQMIDNIDVESIKDETQQLQLIEKARYEVINNARAKLIGQIVALLKVPQIQSLFSQNLTSVVSSKHATNGILQLAENFIAKDVSFKEILSKEDGSLNREFISDTNKFIMNLTSKFLGQTSNIVKIYDQYEKLGQQTDRRQTEQLLQNIFSGLVDITDKVAPIFRDKSVFQQYLNKNRLNIQSTIKNYMKHFNVDATYLSSNIVGKVVDVAPKILDLGVTIISEALKDQVGLREIMVTSQEYARADSNSVMSKFTSLTKSIINFINKQENIVLKNAISTKLSSLLSDNAEDIGKILDSILVNTKFGKKLERTGGKITKLIAKDIPAITNILNDYYNHNYSGMLTKSAELLKANMVAILLLGIGIAIDLLRYVMQKFLTSNSRRMFRLTKNLLKLPKFIQGEQRDLGPLLEKYAITNNISEISRTINYCLTSQDFSGLKFDLLNIEIAGMKIQGFNFDKTQFGSKTFKNSEIINCSFKGTIFKEKPNFESAIIDAKSLPSLLESIRKYNKQKTPNDKIILDKVKIIGDISHTDFKDIPIKDLDLSKAHTISVNEKRTVANLDFTLVRELPETAVSPRLNVKNLELNEDIQNLSQKDVLEVNKVTYLIKDFVNSPKDLPGKATARELLSDRKKDRKLDGVELEIQ